MHLLYLAWGTGDVPAAQKGAFHHFFSVTGCAFAVKSRLVGAKSFIVRLNLYAIEYLSHLYTRIALY